MKTLHLGIKQFVRSKVYQTSFKNSSLVILQSLKMTPSNPTRISFSGTVTYMVSFVMVT